MKAGMDLLPVCHETARREVVHEALRRMIVEGAISPEEDSARIGRRFAAKNKTQNRTGEEETFFGHRAVGRTTSHLSP
jgi:hypothetical protein